MASDVKVEQRHRDAAGKLIAETPPYRAPHANETAQAFANFEASLTPATDGVVHTPIEAVADGKIPVEFYQWLYGIERDVLVWSLTPNEIAALIAALSANRGVIEAEMLERAAIAARNALCDMEWPPEDGDQQIDEVMAAIRALGAVT